MSAPFTLGNYMAQPKITSCDKHLKYRLNR
nr:MAG TPA: hypothetical protein [Caudoviricetes sp.]